MKKIILHIAFALIAFVTASSCDTLAPYNTEGVVIDMDIRQLGSGFCEVKFKPSDDAWYYADVTPVLPDINPQEYKTEFMSLALDGAYLRYIGWRHGQLLKLAPYVADFASHSLRYKESDDYFCFLHPDKDYWLFAFVVDPKSNEPRGELFFQTIHTRLESDVDVTLLYKVKGSWDYGYPLDKDGKLTVSVPWIGMTYDSEDIADQMSSMTPYEFFYYRYEDQEENKKAVINRGVYAHNNDGLGDGTSATLFKEGHTYYTCMAVLDGHFSQHVIYKFTWTKDIDLTFMPADSLSDQW